MKLRGPNKNIPTLKQERIRLVVEASPSGMIMVNEAGIVLLVNSQIERLFGYGREELLGQSVEILVPVEIREKHPGLRAGFFSDAKARAMGAGRDLFGQRKDGTQFPIEIGLNPVMTENEHFVLASIVDITERKRAEFLLQEKLLELQKTNQSLQNAEKKIRESAERASAAEAYLKMALKASNTGIWSWQICEDKVTVDDQCKNILGLAQNVKIEKLDDVVQYVHPDDRQLFKESIEKSIASRQEYDVEFRTIWSDGSLHYLSANGKVIFDEQNNPVCMTGMSRDITKQKMERENEKRILILEKHEEFVATLTHDLKTPLHGGDRILDLFLSGSLGALDEKQLGILRVLRESNADMLALIQNLLDVYRYDRETQTLVLSEVDIAAQAESCLKQLSATAEGSGIKLIPDFRDGNHTIRADAVAIRRILMNLLSNALKFTGTNGSVIISGREDGDSYLIEVKDTGVGMPQADLESLFEKYSQGKLGRKYQAGTGLGLYLCRQLVKAHCGKISCKSEEGSGTSFFVVLPIPQNN